MRWEGLYAHIVCLTWILINSGESFPAPRYLHEIAMRRFSLSPEHARALVRADDQSIHPTSCPVPFVPSIHTLFWSMIVARVLGPASKLATARELGKLTGSSTYEVFLEMEPSTPCTSGCTTSTSRT